METKTEKMEWSKPVLEELGRSRYTLGGCGPGTIGNEACNSGLFVLVASCTVGSDNPQVCGTGGIAQNRVCQDGSSATTCRIGSGD